MNHLDLFSGIGGFSLGLEKAGFTTKAFCEMDPFCKLVLNKHWKDIPVYDNIKTLNGTQIEKDIGAIDIITGGFPCQPYSVAGKQKGTNDDRYLWPEMFRVIKEVQPTFVIAENVKGLVNIQDGMVFETVCSDLESEGFEVQTFIIPAAGIGAPHKRERVWIVGYSEHNGSLTSKIRRGNPQINARTEEGQNTTIESERTSGSQHHAIMENSRRTLRQGSQFGTENENEIREEDANQFERSSETREDVVANTESIGAGESRKLNQEKRNQESHATQFNGSGTNDADTDFEGLQGLRSEHGLRKDQSQEQVSWPRRWEFEPDVGRVAHGVSGRAHRLKALGNAIVPQIAEEIGKAIMEVYHG